MKTRIILTIVFITLQLVFAFLPLIPGLRSLLPVQPNPREQLEWQIQVMGVSFTILTATLAVLFLLQENDRHMFEKAVRTLLPHTKIDKLRDDTFYSQFLVATKTARHFVNIMYLSPYPPDHTTDKDRLRYYEDLLTVIKRRTEVGFRRIIRSTPNSKAWIERLLKDLEGCPNANVAVLREPGSDEMPLALSTQVIDGEKTWLVAIGEQERKGAYRDLYIESTEMSEAFQKYYDRIWNRSIVYLDAGRITAEGNKFLGRAHI